MEWGRVLLLQDWFAEDDWLNPSLFALLELFPQAHVGFLRNNGNTLPRLLSERRTEFYAARVPAKKLQDLDTLLRIQTQIPIRDYDLVVCNTRGYLRHLRRERDLRTRIIVYQHDLLPFLWRVDTNTFSNEAASELLRRQELDLEYSAGIDTLVAANFALRDTLEAMHRRTVPLAYPLVDESLFYPDHSAQQEYFVASDATDLHVLLPLFACLKDTLVVLREARPVPLFRELVPDNILYTGKISTAEKAYYLGGARALICGAAHELDHLPLAALRSQIAAKSIPLEVLEPGDYGLPEDVSAGRTAREWVAPLA
ncbi:MAG: hypothetical protein N2Z22_07040, partial [Turneriella sp.]|nr:hypothetical protein [Turneriella sp.]